MTGTLGERVIDACLRRVQTSEALRHDLVLVRDHVALADVPAGAVLVGEPWRIERVTGELTLRDALPDAGRLVAVIPAGFVPPPDIAGRAWLNKALDIRADDVVTGLTGRACEPLPDEDVAEAVVDGLDLLRVQVGRWSQHGLVSAAEVRAVLVAADLGTDERLDRERDYLLLARWILQRAPQSRMPGLLGRALEEAFPRTGRWLAWVARTGDVPGLIAAGAVSADAGRSTLEPAPRTSSERQDLRALVDLAVREAWRVDEARTTAALDSAETAFHRLRVPEDQAPRYPLVRAALTNALHAFARRAAEGRPPDDAAVDGLKANLHAGKMLDSIDLVRDLARLARALRVEPPGTAWEDWARFGRDHVAWLDLAIRRVRRRVEVVAPDLREQSETLLSRALSTRDAWNRGFAAMLAEAWPKVAASKDLRRPLPLQHVSRSLIARLLDDPEKKVLLIVLDGCDLSTFIEIAETLPEGIGLALPAANDASLRTDLDTVGPFQVAISPLPTVTSHARRALFAGEIPGNTALDATEEVSANSTADKQAFARNVALRDIPRELFLKGDLGDPAGLVGVLERSASRLIAVVFNAVDDALSSKETTALGPWSVASLGVGAAEVLRVAVERGWTVIVTADHGHTPFVSTDRKVAPRARGGRFHEDALAGATRFDSGPLPHRPLFLLSDVGAWAGHQHRGYHGGAGLEEVLVPLALIGRGQGRARSPGWWWSAEAVDVPLREAPVARSAAPVTPVVRAATPRVSDAVRAALVAQPAWLAALEHLAERQVLTLAQLAGLVGRPTFFVAGMMSSALAELKRAGVPAPFAEDPEGTERIYRWHRGT